MVRPDGVLRRRVLRALGLGATIAPASLGLASLLGAWPTGAQPIPGGDKIPNLLVRLRSRDARAFKEFVRANKIGFASAPPRLDPDGTITGVVVMTRSQLAKARLIPALRAEIVARPPTTQSELPRVGRGNRFDDPKVLPQGRGVLVSKP